MSTVYEQDENMDAQQRVDKRRLANITAVRVRCRDVSDDERQVKQATLKRETGILEASAAIWWRARSNFINHTQAKMGKGTS